LISAGLLKVLVRVFNCQIVAPQGGFELSQHNKNLSRRHETIEEIYKGLCEYDRDIVNQFHELGIPEGSSFFDSIITNHYDNLFEL
jgi:hypothetical protein